MSKKQCPVILDDSNWSVLHGSYYSCPVSCVHLFPFLLLITQLSLSCGPLCNHLFCWMFAQPGEFTHSSHLYGVSVIKAIQSGHKTANDAFFLISFFLQRIRWPRETTPDWWDWPPEVCSQREGKFFRWCDHLYERIMADEIIWWYVNDDVS